MLHLYNSKLKARRNNPVYSDLFSIDINECDLNKCHSSSLCTNTDGSYICSCRTGYRMDNDTCVGTTD